jgi:hypothetical protein
MSVFFIRRGAAPILLPDKGKALNEYTWNEINKISASGLASEYWSVGDCKEIVLNGTIGTLPVENFKTCVFILGFNHNGASNTIDFGTFKSALSGGTDMCLIDSNYSATSTGGSKLFNMNHTAESNVGGWKSSNIRYDVLGSTDVFDGDASETCATNPVSGTLMAALPVDLRSVMKPMAIRTNNTGASNADSVVTTTIDYLPLLAEFEIFGTRTYANQYENKYQAQYQYYKDGASSKKYRHTELTNSANWWGRSARGGYSSHFCCSSHQSVYDYANKSLGLAPIFRV